MKMQKTYIYLGVASFLCSCFFIWSVLLAWKIDNYFPEDSRVGIPLGICTIAWYMAGYFTFHALWIGRQSERKMQWPVKLLHLPFLTSFFAFIPFPFFPLAGIFAVLLLLMSL